jgi:hypothetical protein
MKVKKFWFVLFIFTHHIYAMELIDETNGSDSHYSKEAWYLAQGFGKKGFLNTKLAIDITKALTIIRTNISSLSNIMIPDDTISLKIIIHKFQSKDIEQTANQMDDFLKKRKYDTLVDETIRVAPALIIPASITMDVKSFIKYYNQKQSKKNGIGGTAQNDHIAYVGDAIPTDNIEFKYVDKKLFQFNFRLASGEKQIIFYNPENQQIIDSSSVTIS